MMYMKMNSILPCLFLANKTEAYLPLAIFHFDMVRNKDM